MEAPNILNAQCWSEISMISVIKPAVVGHITRQISTCNLFIQSRYNITCVVIGRCQYSVNVLQGDPEVPCWFTIWQQKCIDLLSSQFV